MAPEFARVRVSWELEEALQALLTPHVFPGGATLFRQGAEAGGIYLVKQGAVRVLLPNTQNQHQLLEIVGPGTVLGLSDTVAGARYRVTAEAEHQATAGFVEREVLLSFLGAHREFCLQIVRLLSDNLHGLYHKFRSVSAHPGRPRRRSLHEQLD